MARHRNVRGMDFDEAYDDYYGGTYGQSVEEDHCISPRTAAEFMFDRGTQNHSMAAYFDDEEELAEDQEGHEVVGESRSKKRSDSFTIPELSQTDQAILHSCMEEIQNVVGDTVQESTLVNAILQHKFNTEAALNYLLDSQNVSQEKPQPQRVRTSRNEREFDHEMFTDASSLDIKAHQFDSLSVSNHRLKPGTNVPSTNCPNTSNEPCTYITTNSSSSQSVPFLTFADGKPSTSTNLNKIRPDILNESSHIFPSSANTSGEDFNKLLGCGHLFLSSDQDNKTQAGCEQQFVIPIGKSYNMNFEQSFVNRSKDLLLPTLSSGSNNAETMNDAVSLTELASKYIFSNYHNPQAIQGNNQHAKAVSEPSSLNFVLRDRQPESSRSSTSFPPEQNVPTRNFIEKDKKSLSVDTSCLQGSPNSTSNKLNSAKESLALNVQWLDSLLSDSHRSTNDFTKTSSKSKSYEREKNAESSQDAFSSNSINYSFNRNDINSSKNMSNEKQKKSLSTWFEDEEFRDMLEQTEIHNLPITHNDYTQDDNAKCLKAWFENDNDQKPASKAKGNDISCFKEDDENIKNEAEDKKMKGLSDWFQLDDENDDSGVSLSMALNSAIKNKDDQRAISRAEESSILDTCHETDEIFVHLKKPDEYNDSKGHCKIIAKPSLFATILCRRYNKINSEAVQNALQAIKKAIDLQKYNATSKFDFTRPSPDDIVNERRKRNAGRRKVTEDHKTESVVKNVTETDLISDFNGRIVFSPDEKTEHVQNEPKEISQDQKEKNTSNDQTLLITEESSSTKSPEREDESDRDSIVSQEKDSTIIKTSTPQSAKSKARDPLASYQKQRENSKPLINLVVIGHVDAGKSTLMGHLLYRLGCVSKKILHRYEQDSKKLGKASFMYAWVLDETSEERARGITMDVAQSKFETPNRTVTLLDAPGHKDFIPNMITGAAQADVAILVVDATRGEFETGFDAGGQTREHTLLIRSLGVSQLAVVVNKLDNVDWLQQRYDEIKYKLGHFLKQAGFRESDVTFVPCSGLTGENLTERATIPALLQWYKGPCLVEVIDNFKPPERLVSKPFRLCISDVFKGTGSGFSVSGKIESGFVRNGDKCIVMPAGENCSIKGVILDERTVSDAFAGDHVALNLSGLDIANVTVGSVICDPSYPIPVTTSFKARIVLFNITVPITKGFPVVLHYLNVCEQAVIKKLISQLNKTTGEVVRKKPRCLAKNCSGIIQLEVSKPICIELYKDYRDLGRFMLRSGGTTIAAGLVVEIL